MTGDDALGQLGDDLREFFDAKRPVSGSEELDAQAGTLTRLVGRFKVDATRTAAVYTKEEEHATIA